MGGLAIGSWNRFQKMNAKRSKTRYFLVARANSSDPQNPLSLQKDGTWEGVDKFYAGRIFKEDQAKKMAELLCVELGVRVWIVEV